MNSSGSLSAQLGDLDWFLRKAIWRVRLERLRQAVGRAIWILLIAATIWTAALIWWPELAWAAPYGVGGAAVALLLAADVALFWQVDRRAVLLRLDRQLGLADATVTSSELAGEPRDGWRRRQLAQTIEDLKQRSWDQHWPRRWPRLTGLAAVTLAVLGALLLHCYFVEKAGAQPAGAPFLQSQLQALEEVFKDWEEAQKKFDDPELRKTLEELKPLREKMAAGELKERDVLAALSRVEDKLEAARKKLEAQSLGSSAAELASAFEPLQGMSSTAAALRRQDFEQAEKLAGEMAAKLEEPNAAPPEGSQNQNNQERIGDVAEKLQERGNQPMSQALQQMERGMKQGDGKEMSGGLRGVAKGLGDQAKRDAEKQRLSTQLAQMGECKECVGSGASLARGMSLIPRLSTEEGGGKGAGSGINPNRFGNETELASNRTEEQLTGTPGAGDSEVTTEKSNEKTREMASGPRPANFREYEKLSREAIEDENIPLAHRQAIRRYFESIRPTER